MTIAAWRETQMANGMASAEGGVCTIFGGQALSLFLPRRKALLVFSKAWRRYQWILQVFGLLQQLGLPSQGYGSGNC